jgi:hypothetical protein
MNEPMTPTAQRDQILRPIRAALPAWFHVMDFKKARRSTSRRRAVVPITREHRRPYRRLDGRAIRFARSLHARVAGQRRELRRRNFPLAAAGRDGGAFTIGTLVDDDLRGGAGRPHAFAARG